MLDRCDVLFGWRKISAGKNWREKEGQVKIEVDAKANGNHGSAFFNNYMLQLTLPFDSASFSDIQAPDGMVANAGKTQQVTFTLMPEKEKTFTVEANTTQFEFDGHRNIGCSIIHVD